MKKPFALQWHITEQCDQRCQHCYVFAAEASRRPLQAASDETIGRVLENCLEMCQVLNREPYFYITGGDPLLHPRFWDLASRLRSEGLSFSILGNPFHLTSDTCARLKELGCERYQLSLDGLRDTHDAIRMNGSFERTLDAIPLIRQAGMRCAIMTTVSNVNLHEIPDLIDVVVEHQADIFAFARYCPTAFEPDTHVTPDAYRALLGRCWVKFEEHRDSGTTFNLKDHLWTLFLHEKGLFAVPDGLDEDRVYDGCHCGDCHLTILPDGSVFACRRFESLVGNALSDRLVDVFTGLRMETYRDFSRFEKCQRCELLRFCRGCPAVAYGYTGNMYAADPQCWRGIA